MATREPPVELFYDPAELDPDAPRLRVARNGDGWELRAGEGQLLSVHPTQDDAIGVALERSKLRFSEILVRGSTGRAEWRVDQNPALPRLREYWRKRQPEGGRRKMGVGVFLGHHVFLPARWRHKDAQGDMAPQVELFYDPAELNPAAPRLHIRKKDGVWELRDSDDTLLGSYPNLPGALDAAETRSRVCFHEILVRGAVSLMEWSVSQNPDLVELARALNRPVVAERQAAD